MKQLYGSDIPEQVPTYWKCSLTDVENAVKEVKKGKVHKLRPSAGGRSIYMIEYGSSNLPPSHATLSSALGAHDYSCYADKSGTDYCPTVFLAGCIHGGEFEGTVAILNLIHLLENGVDYAGNTDLELLSLADKLHFVLVPMCNPDGRSHIPFDNFVGRSFYDLRYYNQGTWKDGSLCGWPDCKRYFPIKEHVDYLGGYFNDDGVNMMHDDFFGNAAAETQNILDLCKQYAPDVSVLFHGGANSENHFTPLSYVSGSARKKAGQLSDRVLKAYEPFGYRFSDCKKKMLSYDHEQWDVPIAFNLTSAMHHCCGELCITFESNQGLIDPDKYCMNNQEIYHSHLLFMKCLFEMVTGDRRV